MFWIDIRELWTTMHGWPAIL